MVGGDASLKDMRAQNKLLSQMVKQLDLNLSIEQEKTRSAEEKMKRLKICHQEEIARLKSCHDAEISHLKKVHDEALQLECTEKQDMLANIVKKIYGSSGQRSTTTCHFTDGDTGSSSDIVDLLRETLLTEEIDPQGSRHVPGDPHAMIAEPAAPDPQIVEEKDLLPMQMQQVAPHIGFISAVPACSSWEQPWQPFQAASSPSGIDRHVIESASEDEWHLDDQLLVQMEERESKETGADEHNEDTFGPSSESSRTSDLSKKLETSARLVKTQLKAQRILSECMGVSFEYLSEGIQCVKSLRSSDDKMEAIKKRIYKHFHIPGDLLVQGLEEINRKGNSAKHPKEKSSRLADHGNSLNPVASFVADTQESSEMTYLQWFLDFIDECGGRILSQDVQHLYTRHPEIKDAIGNGKLREFCDKHEELVYEHNGKDGVAATIRRQATETVCLQWLLEFIDERGGRILSQDVQHLYTRHPKIKDAIGNGKLREFCEKHDELVYEHNDGDRVAATIRRRRQATDADCLRWLLEFIDERRGRILSQDVQHLYTRHPEIKYAIGNGKLRDFCDKHEELVYEHSGKDGVAATIRRQATETVSLQRLGW